MEGGVADNQRIARLPRAMPVSRLLRLALGLALLAGATQPLLAASLATRLRVVGVVVTLIVAYTAVHHVVSRHFGWLHPWFGAAIALAPALAAFIQGGAYEIGVIAFIGLSLVVIAVLGHPGCEVLAVPALILRRRTHLACILFSPLDWIEGKVAATFRDPSS